MPSDAYKVFLQTMLKKRVLTVPEAKALKNQLCQRYNIENQELLEFIRVINDGLIKLHMAIRKSVQEDYDEDIQCFVLINNYTHEMTRMYSSFSKPELGFVKQLIESLVTSEDGSISELVAVGFGSNSECRIGAVAAEAVIDKLVYEKWILRNEGHLSLGALTVCELLDQNSREENSKCFFCKEYTYRGYTCPECETRGHRSCLHSYWKKLRKNFKCPSKDCGAEWQDESLASATKRIRLADDDDN